MNGQTLDRIKFVDNGIQRLQVIEPNVWVVARANRHLVLFSKADGFVDEISLATEHPGWLELCVSSDRKRIVALSTDNQQRMMSNLSVFRAN